MHLVTLGASLRDHEIGLRVIKQGIDTSTTIEGRAMFGMLSVLAELQSEVIVTNTRDGLAGLVPEAGGVDGVPRSTVDSCLYQVDSGKRDGRSAPSSVRSTPVAGMRR